MDERFSRLRPRALLFDMDGTLTRPLLDFDAIRRDLRVEGPILEALRKLEGDRLREAHTILDAHERTAAERSELNDGCVELLSWLRRHEHRTGLITRNSRSSTNIILDKHALRFDLVLTREDEPPKPDPQSLRHAMRTLACCERETWMIGDGSHDIEAAVAAGVHSVWLSHGNERSFSAEPDVTIATLEELLPMLQKLDHLPLDSERV